MGFDEEGVVVPWEAGFDGEVDGVGHDCVCGGCG